MAEDNEIVVAKITNNGPGPRMFLTPEGGRTIQRFESVTMRCSTKDLRSLESYVALGHIKVEEGDEDDIVSRLGTSKDIGGEMPAPSSPVDKVLEGQTGDIVPVNDVQTEDAEFTGPDSTDGEAGQDSLSSNAAPDSVLHRGFGRYYGMKDGEAVTEAMTQAEASAYAEEHGLELGAAPNPSEDGVTEETPADESGGEGPDQTEA